MIDEKILQSEKLEDEELANVAGGVVTLEGPISGLEDIGKPENSDPLNRVVVGAQGGH